MNRKAIAITATVLGLAAVGLWASERYLRGPRPGPVTDSGTAAGPTFQVRVLERDEIGAYLPGAYYEFEARPNGDEQWHHVMTVRHDDPAAIPTDRIRFVGERVGYMSMCWQYAVTTDGGRTWAVWDASKVAELRQFINYGMIQEVAIDETGKGTMTLNDVAGARGGPRELTTSDFGQRWVAGATPN